MHTILMMLAVLLVSSAALAYTLTWDPNQETDLAGYNLYRKLEACGLQGPLLLVRDLGNVLSTMDLPIVSGGTTLCWALTAYNTGGGESAFSNTVEATTPADPVPIVCVKRNPKGKCVQWSNS